MHKYILWLMSVGNQNVMQGAHNFVMTDTTLYVAQNVCTVTMALMV